MKNIGCNNVGAHYIPNQIDMNTYPFKRAGVNRVYVRLNNEPEPTG